MTTWTELARLAQTAPRADRELDGSVAALVYGVDPYEAIDVDLEVFVSGEFLPVPRWSASVDAVLALIAEKLPEWQVDTLRQEDTNWHACLDRIEPFQVARADTPTPALALLAAFCLAIAASETAP